ncbi:MAG TPA: hypothetical protein VHZ26_00910 [Caulobacteraceae bacterium]|jgi:hypothetical protein|nr:hypothetical protein [Caulobacteraceae bacterium]
MDASPVRLILMYFIVPLWLAAGVADWLCHRRAKIQSNASYPESLLHLLMLAEIGAPVLIVLFFQVDALVLAIGAAAFVAHEATAFWDVAYAVRHRVVSPIEQMVHSFLELVPLTALVCLVALHWDQFLALFGIGHAAPDFSLRLRQPPLPIAYLVATLICVVVFEALPFGEELVRCLLARRRPAARSGRVGETAS